jgi:hypothetical protein
MKLGLAFYFCPCYTLHVYGGYSSMAERLIVVQNVVGSSPIIHPKTIVEFFVPTVALKTIIYSKN